MEIVESSNDESIHNCVEVDGEETTEEQRGADKVETSQQPPPVNIGTFTVCVKSMVCRWICNPYFLLVT